MACRALGKQRSAGRGVKTQARDGARTPTRAAGRELLLVHVDHDLAFCPA